MSIIYEKELYISRKYLFSVSSVLLVSRTCMLNTLFFLGFQYAFYLQIVVIIS